MENDELGGHVNNEEENSGSIFSRKNIGWKCVYKGLWICKDVAICLFGIIGAIIGTYSTLSEVVATFGTSVISRQCKGA